MFLCVYKDSIDSDWIRLGASRSGTQVSLLPVSQMVGSVVIDSDWIRLGASRSGTQVSLLPVSQMVGSVVIDSDWIRLGASRSGTQVSLLPVSQMVGSVVIVNNMSVSIDKISTPATIIDNHFFLVTHYINVCMVLPFTSIFCHPTFIFLWYICCLYISLMYAVGIALRLCMYKCSSIFI